MLKNISNININNIPPAYRTSHSQGNRNVGNASNQQVPVEKSQNNVKNNNNPILINISEEGRQAASDSQMTDAQNNLIDKAASKMMDMQNELARMKSEGKALVEQMKNGQKQVEGHAEMLKTRMRCMLIASRIMSGNEVDKADIKYLQKHDPDLYQKAVSRRVEIEDPKKHKRITEDEKPEGSNESIDPASDESIESGSGDSMGASEVSVETGGGEYATNSETTE